MASYVLPLKARSPRVKVSGLPSVELSSRKGEELFTDSERRAEVLDANGGDCCIEVYREHSIS
jgi:hypothetical protein